MGIFGKVLIFNNMGKEHLEAMSKLGIAASKAGVVLRNTILAMKKLQKCSPPHKQWQRPYKYHR